MIDWRPIESAPKNGDEVLLFYPGHSSCPFAVGWWFSLKSVSEGHWSVLSDTDGDYYGCAPTHWAPLTEPTVA